MSILPRVSVNVVLGRRQRGVVLLAFFLVLFLAGVGAIITVLDNNTASIRRNTDTMVALRKAKESLLAYAVLYAENYSTPGVGPGYLPCPDTNGNGLENAPCGPDSLGRLPTSIVLPSGSTVPLSSYNNGIDEQFWYSVADNFRHNPTSILNSAATSTVTLNGQTGIAAVIIAPGPVTGTQSRPSNSSIRYLEDSNTSAPSFVSNDPLDPDNFNDRVLVITIDEIFAPIVRIVANIVKTELDIYHAANTRYPATQVEFDASIIVPTTPWYAVNYRVVPRVVTYNWITDDSASLTFTGCDNISFQLAFNPSAIVQTGSRC